MPKLQTFASNKLAKFVNEFKGVFQVMEMYYLPSLYSVLPT